MESNGYEHQLFEAVKALNRKLTAVSRHVIQDCGSDYNATTCEPCGTADFCAACEELKKPIKQLEAWGC